MTARRFVVPDVVIAEGATFSLPERVASHVRVLRLVPGDALELVGSEEGVVGHAVLEDVTEDRVTVTVVSLRRVADEAPRMTLVQCIPKGDKLDGIVRMATELGASEVVLALGERSVARWEPSRADAKVARLTRVAVEAARQAERTRVPGIRFEGGLVAFLRRESADGVLVGLSPRVEATLTEALNGAASATLVVGPEGGLSPAEEAALLERGGVLARFSPYVLRVETAGPAALAVALVALQGDEK